LADSSATREYRNGAFPRADAPWREVEFTVLDLELTGLDPEVNEIVSFGTVTVAGGRIRLDDARYGTVRPKRMPDPDTIRIHGLREGDLADAPDLDQALDEILEAITGRALVAHVAAIDTGFLRTALRSRGLRLKNPIVDTAALAQELLRVRRGSPPGDPIGLSDLARYLGLPVHRPHHADGDALTTAQAFIALATHLDAFGKQTLGSLGRISLQPVEKPRSLIARLRRFVSRRD
jgi:DNA polymerase III subunit epsilon